MSAIDRAIARIEKLIEGAERSQLETYVSNTHDPDDLHSVRGWEAARALTTEELRRIFNEDEGKAYELYDTDDWQFDYTDDGRIAAYHSVLDILREERDAVLGRIAEDVRDADA